MTKIGKEGTGYVIQLRLTGREKKEDSEQECRVVRYRYYVSLGYSAKIGKDPVTYKALLHKGPDNYIVTINRC